MKKLSCLFVLFIFCDASFAQDVKATVGHQLSVDFGSYRNRYLYPITNIQYGSPIFSKHQLKVSARLRSYGTLFFYSKSSYDFTPLVEHFFLKKSHPIYFSAGVGMDFRLRFGKDERSSAMSSAEPFVSICARYNHSRFSIYTSLWTRFYSNGISFSILPEFFYRVHEHFFVFLRDEVGYQKLYKFSADEFRHDVFIGVRYMF